MPWRCWPAFGHHKYVLRDSNRAGCSWMTRGEIQASINGFLVAPHGHKLCVAFRSVRRACTSQARGRNIARHVGVARDLQSPLWPAVHHGQSQPLKASGKAVESLPQRPAPYSTPDACCWWASRIRTETTHSRTEVNGTVVRSSGGQSGRLKAGWSQNMQRCFHHLQRSMRRRLASSLVPCPGAWAGCWQRCGVISPYPIPLLHVEGRAATCVESSRSCV